MRFLTAYNAEPIELEYDEIEAAADGLVYSCEVLHQGINVTGLLIDRYDEFLMECEQHLAAVALKERQESEYDRGQDRFEEMRRAA